MVFYYTKSPLNDYWKSLDMFYRAVTLAIHFGQIDKYGKSIKDSMLQIEQF